MMSGGAGDGSGAGPALLYFGPQGVRGTPGFTGAALVAHAMTVSAQERQIIQPGLAWPGYVKGEPVVNLDVALTEGSVEVAEVEGADFTLQRLSQLLCLGDLASSDASVAFAMQGPSSEETAFDRRVPVVVDLVRVFWDLVQCASADTLPQGSGSPEHFRGPSDEGGDYLFVQPPALGGCAGVSRMVRGEISSFVTDAADGSELSGGLRSTFVYGERTEKAGEIEHTGVTLAQLIPVVLHHEGASQQQLVAGPCRALRHGPYRMSVRCHVWGGRSALVCDAHLEAVVLSVGSVTLCDDWRQWVPVGKVWEEGA